MTSGLVRHYHARGGSREVRDGATLAAAARGGDPHARDVFDWAAVSIADLVTRLQLLCDPEAVVIGGGLARAYDILEPVLAGRLPVRREGRPQRARRAGRRGRGGDRGRLLRGRLAQQATGPGLTPGMRPDPPPGYERS